jgi:hypothetical protein
MTLTIKNVPEWLYEALKQGAAEQRRSLKNDAILALISQAEEIERRRKMRETRPELERFAASLPKMPSSAPLICADRKRH